MTPVDTVCVFNSTFLPREVCTEVARERWKSVKDGCNVFPVGSTFWLHALKFERRRLSQNSKLCIQLRHFEKLVSTGGVTNEFHKANVLQLENLKKLLAVKQKTLKELWLDAASRERRAVRRALARLGFTTPTEEVGMQNGGLCGEKSKVNTLRLSALKAVPRPPPSVHDPVRFPWPPRRGADCYNAALATCRSRLDKNEQNISHANDLLSSECEDDVVAFALFESDLLNHATTSLRTNMLPRSQHFKLSWYYVQQILSPDVHFDNLSLPFGDKRGYTAAHAYLCETLIGLSSGAQLDSALKAVETIGKCHAAIQESCSRIQRRIDAIQATRPSGQVLKFVSLAAEDTLLQTIESLSVTTLLALKATCREFRDSDALQKALPRFRWMTESKIWSPTEGRIVHRYGQVIGTPLVFGRLVGAEQRFVKISPLMHLKRMPKIKAELVFDAPGLPLVPAGREGPPLRHVEKSEMEEETINMQLITFNTDSGLDCMPTFRVMALSSQFAGMFAAEIASNCSLLRQSQASSVAVRKQIHDMEEMQKRNQKAQSFRIRCAVDCGPGSPVFEVVSPPFQVVSRLAKRPRH